MDYNDFEKEMKEYEKKFEEELQKIIEIKKVILIIKLPQ